MKKKPLKKSKKKVGAKKKSRVSRVKKKPAATKAKKVAKAKGAEKPIGTVTHFFTHIKVAIVRFKTKVPAGAKLHYKGATTDFADEAKSMQYDRKPVKVAPKGKQIGIKVKKRVREGDLVYRTE
ncbi:MAG TPA: translation elongation factor-like protein [Candidatus Paceibacterota bacterium]|nr:translation elongation factor-like protein [Candidatus Paceibacterota bacterium]